MEKNYERMIQVYIYLIRHGQSRQNDGSNYVQRIPDHLIELTEEGINQARDGGVWLAEYCKKENVSLDRARIWRSPHCRTRQTSDEFNRSLGIKDIREDVTLIEQQFGLFDSIPYEQWGGLYPREFEEYQRQVQNQGKFYARLPLGESPFDVAMRVNQFFGTIYRDYEKKKIDTLFVFSHGTTIRAFLLRWFHYSPEWYHGEENPGNCWIRKIDGDKDCGYINI